MFIRYHKGHVPRTMTGSGLKLPKSMPRSVGTPHSQQSLPNRFSNLTITPSTTSQSSNKKTRKYIKF